MSSSYRFASLYGCRVLHFVWSTSEKQGYFIPPCFILIRIVCLVIRQVRRQPRLSLYHNSVLLKMSYMFRLKGQSSIFR